MYIIIIIIIINPLTAPARKFSGMKSAHIHASKMHIWWAYNKSTFNAVDSRAHEKSGKSLNVFKFGTFVGVFRVMVQQARQSKG